MKCTISYLVSAILLGSFSVASWSQTPESIAAQKAVTDTLERASVVFKEGLLAYENKNLVLASNRFDRTVEIFLYSTLNMHREARLQNCYNQVIETIYRIEFPMDNQLPQIRNLSQTCGWNIDTALADKITVLAKTSIPKTVAGTSLTTINRDREGFTLQEFEPSSLDELSKLELTQEEEKIEVDPLARKQYRYIELPLDNKSRSLITVKAKAGETVSQIAHRHNVPATEVAKFNGLLPNSTLGAGREIKIPNAWLEETWQRVSKRTGVKVSDLIAANPGITTPRGRIRIPVSAGVVESTTYSRPITTSKTIFDPATLLGPKPAQTRDGS